MPTDQDKLEELKAITSEGISSLAEILRQREGELHEIQVKVDRLYEWMQKQETFLDGDDGARERIRENEVRIEKLDEAVGGIREETSDLRQLLAEIRSGGRTTWNAVLYGLVLLFVGLLIWAVTTIFDLVREKEELKRKNESRILQSEPRERVGLDRRRRDFRQVLSR